MEYAHPLDGRPCPVVVSGHVSKDKGTGLVHTAPAHGREDFQVALQNGIPTVRLASFLPHEKSSESVLSQGCVPYLILSLFMTRRPLFNMLSVHDSPSLI